MASDSMDTEREYVSVFDKKTGERVTSYTILGNIHGKTIEECKSKAQEEYPDCYIVEQTTAEWGATLAQDLRYDGTGYQNPPEQTEEEKADAAAQEEANSISAQLNTIERKAVRAMLNGSAVSSLSTEYQVTLASVTDSAALKMQDYFPEWSGESVSCGAGDRVTYNGTLYKVLQAHTSQAAWTPDAAPSLFAKVLTSTTGEPLPWEQPGSTNPYMKGDRVTYNGKTYESLIDNNVWSPDAYPAGWKEVS